ncbi:MAG: nuclear transport factor 2 family protein [Parvibaculales bacterium]
MTDIPAMIDKLYAASGAGDFETCEAMMTDDFKITEADNLPFGGVYEGKTALRDLYAKVMSMMSIKGLSHSHLMVGEDCGVVLVEMELDGPPIQLLEMFLFRDGKLCEIRPYYFNADNVKANCA